MDIKELVEILIAPACMVILAALLNRKDTAFRLQLQSNENKRMEKETAREEMWLLSIRGNTAYVYGMGVKIGMRERDPNGNVYVAIQAMTKQLNPPSELEAIFKVEG